MFFRNLETDRLFLKKLSLDDAEFVYESMRAPEIEKYVCNIDSFESVEESEEFVKYLLDKGETQRWTIIRKFDGVKIGSCGVYHLDDEKSSCKMVVELFKRFWGNGYMMEASQAIMSFLHNFTTIKKIELEVYADNETSIALAKRLGFVKTDRQAVYPYKGEDRVHDVYEYIDFEKGE